MTTQGNPRCEFCHGKGGYVKNGRWRKCACARMTAEKWAWQHYANSPPGTVPRPDGGDSRVA